MVNGSIARDAGQEVTPSDTLDLNVSRRALSAARLDLPRLYEDAEILVIDKPAGLLTMATDPDAKARKTPCCGGRRSTRGTCTAARGYAGVLHRLDRDTSGALAIALSREAHARRA